MRLLLYTSLLLALGTQCVAQEDTTRFFVEAGGVVATAQRTPFWLRANQFGTVPLENPFAFVKTGGQVTLGTNPRKAQLHLQGEVVANAGRFSSLLLPVASASFRYRRFEAYVGRKKEFFGLGDTLLTSGSYAWSGNALPLPKIQIGTRGFVPLGFTKGLFAVHAMMAHGWFINADSVKNSYLHQKAVYLRLGKPHWKVHFYGGVHHLAQWGGQWRNPVKGSNLTLENGKLPSDFGTFLTVFRAAEAPDPNAVSVFDALNRTGNHLGSIDAAIEWTTPKSNWLFYHQHPYEDKSGVFFVNFPDGLYGLRWRKSTPASSFAITQLNAEFLTTMNQSGYEITINRRRFDGADDYFVNYQYQEGWAYHQRVIGTPFITRRWDTQPQWYNIKGGPVQNTTISNNRVKMVYLGMCGQFSSNLTFVLRASYVQNHGRPVLTDPAFPLSQTSLFLKLTKTISNAKGIYVTGKLSLDRGQWLPSSAGGLISFLKVLR
ncbi:MAG TPA: hypothetical protein DCM71_02090 [Runella sp.]|nr:hypothetical protein [Runella sp.]